MNLPAELDLVSLLAKAQGQWGIFIFGEGDQYCLVSVLGDPQWARQLTCLQSQVCAALDLPPPLVVQVNRAAEA